MSTEKTPPLDRRRLLRLVAAMSLTVIVWIFLVDRAIHFGSQGRDGESAAWFFAFLATLGATACLFVTLILGNKVLSTLRSDVRPQEVPTAGRRVSR
jgi:hypothetical protein